MNDLHKLFLSELKAIYDGEKQLADALAQMEKDAVSPEVKRVFSEGIEQARSHSHRIEEAFDSVGESPERKTCHGLQGIIKEGQVLAAEVEAHSALENGFITMAEKSEHFRISSYGTLCTWAEELGHNRAAELLKQNLGEAKAAAGRLSQLADSIQDEESKREHELERLLVRQLRQMLDGENLLVSALAEVEFYAVSKLLKVAVHHHLWQTEKHVRRLQQVFSDLGETADRRPCDGLEGIIDDAQVVVMEFLNNSALDAALIASAQKAGHYEMAAYESLCRLATHLGRDRVVPLLQQNLSEEVSTDHKLSLAAELLRNQEARRSESAKRAKETAEFLKLATHGE